MGEIKITVLRSELLEVRRLALMIQNPSVVYKRRDPLGMAQEVIDKSIGYTSSILDIINRWIE